MTASKPRPALPKAAPVTPARKATGPARKPAATTKTAGTKPTGKTAAKPAPGEKAAAIIATLKAIPPGHVTSYGEVAKRAGLPGYARFVCRVLRDLPDRETPWWRVIRSDGKFAMGTTTGAGKIQYTRLKEEGLEIKGERVVGPWW